MIPGQLLLGGERKTPRKFLQTGHGGVELGELFLVKGVVRQDGPEQLAQLPELAGFDGLPVGKVARHQLCGAGLPTTDCMAAGAGALARDGAGLKNVTRQPPVAARIMPK